jgi:hypothetical protein
MDRAARETDRGEPLRRQIRALPGPARIRAASALADRFSPTGTGAAAAVQPGGYSDADVESLRSQPKAPGPIDLDRLSSLGGQFDIPTLGLEATQK